MIAANAARRITAALGFTLALVGVASPAHAGAYCQPPAPCGHYEWVEVTKCVEIPYIRLVTLFDHCNRPYQVERTAHRTVEVTVRKRVFVRD